MKNKNNRKKLTKIISRVSYISVMIFVTCLIIGMFFGDLIYSGVYVFAFGLIVFIVLQIIQYKMMYRCRCRACGHTEIFNNKWIIISGVKSKCPKCGANINIDEATLR